MKLLLLISLLGIALAAPNPDCKNHKLGYDSFVCVCSESEPCDKIEGATKTDKGVVSRWESSRDGARLRKSTLHFGSHYTSNTSVLAPQGQLHIKIDQEKKYQKVLGFGGAFTDSTGVNLKSIGDKLTEQILIDYFSKDGLEYNIGRVPIGGCDFSTRGYALDDGKPDFEMARFNLSREDYELKIPIIQQAQKLATHELRIFGSPWSAPAWMKTNNDISHGGSLRPPVGGQYYASWAKYFVRWLDMYKAHGITPWGITPQNEPYAYGYNSMAYTPDTMRLFIAHNLGPTLEQAGYGPDKLKVMVWDHNMDQVQRWTDAILSDEVANKYSAGIAVHWYTHSPKQLLDQPARKFPDKFILSTEACEGPGVKLGAWSAAESYASDILTDFQYHVVGWVDWNLVLDTRGGPNWVNNFVDAPIIADAQAKVYYRQPHFYALGHFSKFLPPGSVRVDSATVSAQGSRALHVAFRTAAEDATVVVVVNPDQAAVELTVEDKPGSFKVTVEPHSIQTFVYYD